MSLPSVEGPLIFKLDRSCPRSPHSLELRVKVLDSEVAMAVQVVSVIVLCEQ